MPAVLVSLHNTESEEVHMARIRLLFIACLTMWGAACSDGFRDPASPPIPSIDEGETAGPDGPQRTESLSNCEVWSCSSGQCSWEPGQYGACCIDITEPEETGASKPSCGEQSGSTPTSFGGYCDALEYEWCRYTRNFYQDNESYGCGICQACSYTPWCEPL